MDAVAPPDTSEVSTPAVADPAPVGELTAALPGHPTRPQGWRAVVLGALALVFLGMGLAQARSDSMTVDESPDIAGGLSLWAHGESRITNEHGLLPRLSFGLLPTLLADPVVPEGESWEAGDWFAYSEDLVAANAERGRLDDVLFWARVPALVVGLLSALVIHALVARWAGPGAALVAAAAWLTTPLVVGMHHLALIDPATALAVLALVLATVRLVEAPSDRRAVVAGAALGALLLCRHAGAPMALVPVGAAVVVSAATRDRVRRGALVVIVAVALVWGAYRAVDPSGPEGDVREQQQALVDTAGEESAAARLVGASPLPLEWRAGFGWLTVSSEPKVSSALGQRWEGSRWWYYPVSLALASPPLTLVLLGLAPLALRGLRRRPSGTGSDADRQAAIARRRSLLATTAATALAFGPLLAQPLQQGPRLMLPVLGLGLVLGSVAAVDRAGRRDPAAGGGRRPLVGLAVLLAGVQVAMLVSSAPSSFGWTLPGLRPEHRWAGAQATDIGQDRDRLATWAEDHRPVAAAVVLPLGQELPAGVADLRDVPDDELTGWVAVSVSALVTFGPELSWLRAQCNVDTVGRSILIYRFTEPPARTPGPALPVAPCPERSTSRRR